MNQERIEPETSNVVGVQFGIMGPEEIRKRSVVEVTKHDTYAQQFWPATQCERGMAYTHIYIYIYIIYIYIL